MKLVWEIYRDNIGFLRNSLRLAHESAGEYRHLWLNLIKPPLRRPVEEENIVDFQRKSFNLLSELFALSKGDESMEFNIYEIGGDLGCGKAEIEHIAETLHRSELINFDKSSGAVFITPYGAMTVKEEIGVGYAPIH